MFKHRMKLDKYMLGMAQASNLGKKFEIGN